MTDDNPRHVEQQSDVIAADGLRVFQFSLTNVFILITVTAMILSTYFGVGRLAGMSTMEVLTQGFGRFLFALPTVLVWIVGLIIAIRRLKRNRLPAALTMIALGWLVVTTLLLYLVQMVLIHLVNSGRISHLVLSWSFTFIGVLHTVLHTTLWILILVAIFAGRPPDASDTEQTESSGNPFLTKEPYSS
jgi:hypothetical protein